LPIQKYKSLADADRAHWNFNPDKKYYEQVHKLFDLASRLNPPNFPHGVFKYETLEEANRQKMDWIVEAAISKNIDE
jgi:hypothetical protein